MAGRTPPEAVQNFIDPIQRSVSCVVDTPLTVRGGYQPAPAPHWLILGDGGAVRLRGVPLAIRIAQHYRIVKWEGPRGPWKVTTVAYWYALEDLESREVLAYHWHPNSGSRLVTPHLHLGTAYAVDPGRW